MSGLDGSEGWACACPSMNEATLIHGAGVGACDSVQDLPLPTFTEFYRAINGRDPFPWQTRLAEHVATNERWPAEIGVSTGLGKR